jgi:hypothetical protein
VPVPATYRVTGDGMRDTKSFELTAANAPRAVIHVDPTSDATRVATLLGGGALAAGGVLASGVGALFLCLTAIFSNTSYATSELVLPGLGLIVGGVGLVVGGAAIVRSGTRSDATVTSEAAMRTPDWRAPAFRTPAPRATVPALTIHF